MPILDNRLTQTCYDQIWRKKLIYLVRSQPIQKLQRIAS